MFESYVLFCWTRLNSKQGNSLNFKKSNMATKSKMTAINMAATILDLATILKSNPQYDDTPCCQLFYFPTPSLSQPTGTYAKWFQTRPTGGHATASYAPLSMGICLRVTPCAVILSLSTMDPAIPQKTTIKIIARPKHPLSHVPQMLV